MSADRPFLVDVFELARDRRTIEGELPLAELPRMAASLLRTDGSLHYWIGGDPDERGRPGATMRLRASLVLECQRCTSELVFPLEREARFRFVVSESELNALPIENDDVDVLVGSRHMNVNDWIEDEAILSLPLVPRHARCQPVVAHSLTAAGADESTERPNPFSALAGLKRGKEPS
jgi:uncharacterized protein